MLEQDCRLGGEIAMNLRHDSSSRRRKRIQAKLNPGQDAWWISRCGPSSSVRGASHNEIQACQGSLGLDGNAIISINRVLPRLARHSRSVHT